MIFLKIVSNVCSVIINILYGWVKIQAVFFIINMFLHVNEDKKDIFLGCALLGVVFIAIADIAIAAVKALWNKRNGNM